MQTHFSLTQLADPDIAEANEILRACVHCGLCTATCPTYVLLGDERDSPRGRIMLIKDMLEQDRPATPAPALHLDRCLSCNACMTACPSGVHYGHLIDHARRHMEDTLKRPLPERLLRTLLAWILPSPRRFNLALALGRLVHPLAVLLPGRLKALAAIIPASHGSLWPRRVKSGVYRAAAPHRARVALLPGCAQQALAPQINAASLRLLARHGVDVVVADGVHCCGALTHHMGRKQPTEKLMRAAVDSWIRELDVNGLDAILTNTTGCGATLQDYGHIMRADPAYAEKSARISALACDISVFLNKLDAIRPVAKSHSAAGLAVSYHAPCTLQHSQKAGDIPAALLEIAGFDVHAAAEGNLCCGSAGVYNLLQPALAGQLGARKAAALNAAGGDVIATGNIGCMVQIAAHTSRPVVHVVELLDWATGGATPAALANGSAK